jgi:hypothetical protein
LTIQPNKKLDLGEVQQLQGRNAVKKQDASPKSSGPGTAVVPAGLNPLQALLVVLLPQQGKTVDTIMFLSVEEERVFKDEATNLVKRVLEAQAANIDTLESRLPAAKAAVMARLAALGDGHEPTTAADEPPAAPPRIHEGKGRKTPTTPKAEGKPARLRLGPELEEALLQHLREEGDKVPSKVIEAWAHGNSAINPDGASRETVGIRIYKLLQRLAENGKIRKTDDRPALWEVTATGRKSPAPPTSERKEGQKGLRPGSIIDQTLRLIVAADPEGISTDGIHETLGGDKQQIYGATSKLNRDGLIERTGTGRHAPWTATAEGKRMCTDGEPTEKKPPAPPPPASPRKSEGGPASAPAAKSNKSMSVLRVVVSAGPDGRSAEATRAEVGHLFTNPTGVISCLKALKRRGLVENVAAPGRGNKGRYVGTPAGIQKCQQSKQPASDPKPAARSEQPSDRAPRKVKAHELFHVAKRDPKNPDKEDESHLGQHGKAPPVALAPVLSLVVNTNSGGGIMDSDLFQKLEHLELGGDDVSAAISGCLTNRWIANSGTEEVPYWKATIKGAEEHKRQLDRVIMFIIDQAQWGIPDTKLWETLEYWGVTLGNVEGITAGWATRKFIEGTRLSWTATDLGTWSVLHQVKTDHGKASVKRPNPLPPIPEKIVPPATLADWKQLALAELDGWNWKLRFSQLVKYAIPALRKDGILTANGDEVIRPLNLPPAPASGAAPEPPAPAAPVTVSDDRPVITDPDDIDVAVFTFIGEADESVPEETVVNAFLEDDTRLQGILPADMPPETRQQEVLRSISRLKEQGQIKQVDGNWQVV